MTVNHPPYITARELIERFDGLLLDAFGVLVDGNGALPGAIEFIDALNASGKPWFVVTNSASQLPATKATAFRARGLKVGDHHILSSGMLLNSYFAEHGLVGARTVVLGPEDAHLAVSAAGGVPLDPATAHHAEVVVIADQKGFPLLEGLDNTLSLILRRLDAGDRTHLLLCNPDIVYPMGDARYGFTAGGLALMFDGILAERYPEPAPRFIRLGKPHRPLFDEAVRRIGSDRVAMVGDQLVTDIRGANRAGLTSVLVQSGLARGGLPDSGELRPDYLLASLDPRE